MRQIVVDFGACSVLAYSPLIEACISLEISDYVTFKLVDDLFLMRENDSFSFKKVP